MSAHGVSPAPFDKSDSVETLDEIGGPDERA